jgi:hypothetical protein
MSKSDPPIFTEGLTLIMVCPVCLDQWEWDPMDGMESLPQCPHHKGMFDLDCAGYRVKNNLKE